MKVVTTAPTAYDYALTNVIEPVDVIGEDAQYCIDRAIARNENVRYVECDEYQRSRYLSGMYLAIEV